MSIRPFDFREIAALDDTAVALRTWFSKSTSFFSDFWDEATGYSAKLGLGSVTNDPFEKILDGIPREDLCCAATLENDIQSMWYAPPSQFRLIVGDLLGLSEADEENNDSLGAIELDLASFFINRLAESVAQGWMGDNELSIELAGLGNDARKLRLFRGKDLIAKICIEVECKLGTAKLNWLIPKQKLTRLMDDTVDKRRSGPPATPPKELVAQLPLQVVTVLGNAKIPMSELGNLKPGQLIRLDQRIDSPMVSLVDGRPSFECWPGRLGDTQAVQVSQRYDD
jgi:flagellar motor switch protein FliM